MMTPDVVSQEWRCGLVRFAALVRPLQVEWMLVGSAATALRGVPVEPGDLDILVRRAEDLDCIAAAMPSVADDRNDVDPATFLSSQRRPVLVFGEGSWALGRWHLGDVMVEVAHIQSAPPQDSLLLETAGARIWGERDMVELEDVSIPTVPVEVQIATMTSRDQHERLRQTLRAVDASNLRIPLLSSALLDRGISDISALPTTLQHALALDGRFHPLGR